MRKLALAVALAATCGVLGLAPPAEATPVTSGLVLWLDGSDGATITTDGSGNIQQWSDKSSAGNDATQPTAANRPVLNATALNGRPAVRFDNTQQDGMAIADGLELIRPYTAFIVNQYHADSTGRTLQSRDDGVNWLMGLWSKRQGYYASGFVNDPNADPAPVGTPFIHEAVGTNKSTNMFFSNGDNRTTASSRSGQPGHLALVYYPGGSYAEYAPADIAEVLVYDRQLSFTERQIVGDYLSQKYGVPTDHAANSTKAGAFAGGDPGDGLDLDGIFRYAVNARGPQKIVGDHVFTEDGGPGTTTSTPGVTVTAGSGSDYATWGTKPDYGTSAADDGLETLMHSIRYTSGTASPNEVKLDMDVVPGRTYKLQLLLSENTLGRAPGTRCFDVYVEGQLVFNELDLNDVMGQFDAAPISQGVVFTREVVAADSQLNIVLDGHLSGTDHGPILQAATLEELSPTLWTTRIGTFTGGDAGDGLDLDGKFVYAVNVFGPAAGQVRDANFTDESVPGVSLTATSTILNWINPNYGSTANDDNLELVMQSIRHGGPQPAEITMGGLEPGAIYQLQLLFAEGCCNRGFDVFLEGNLVADDFSPLAIQGGAAGDSATTGVVLSHQFVAWDGTLHIVFDGAGTQFPDKNPIIQGFTLELVPEPTTLALLGLGALALVRRRRRA